MLGSAEACTVDGSKVLGASELDEERQGAKDFENVLRFGCDAYWEIDGNVNLFLELLFTNFIISLKLLKDLTGWR